MDEATIKLEMRLAAIEYLLCKVHLAMVLMQGVQPEQFDQFATEFVASAGDQRFSVGDPALSDLATAEWQEAIERLIGHEKDFLAQMMSARSRG